VLERKGRAGHARKNAEVLSNKRKDGEGRLGCEQSRLFLTGIRFLGHLENAKPKEECFKGASGPCENPSQSRMVTRGWICLRGSLCLGCRTHRSATKHASLRGGLVGGKRLDCLLRNERRRGNQGGERKNGALRYSKTVFRLRLVHLSGVLRGDPRPSMPNARRKERPGRTRGPKKSLTKNFVTRSGGNNQGFGGLNS